MQRYAPHGTQLITFAFRWTVRLLGDNLPKSTQLPNFFYTVSTQAEMDGFFYYKSCIYIETVLSSA